jgi:hypothetical protein
MCSGGYGHISATPGSPEPLRRRIGRALTDLNTVQRYVYYATLLTTAVALVFLLAPSAYHRLRFREGDKDAMVRKGNRERSQGPAPSPWPSPACCTSSPTWSSPPKPRSRSRWVSSR